MLQKNVIPFLTELASNNNKEWFTANKSFFQLAQADFKQFIDDLIPQLAITDPLLRGLEAKNCVYRIYRDVRFSHDKTPYKINFGASIAPGGRKGKLATFYVHVEPSGTSITGGGMYMPESPVLKALRNEFFQVPEELIEILENPKFKTHFNGLWQEGKLKKAPQGFSPDFEHIELLKLKNYIAMRELTNTEIAHPQFISHLVDIHKAMYPLNRLLNTIVTDAKL